MGIGRVINQEIQTECKLIKATVVIFKRFRKVGAAGEEPDIIILEPRCSGLGCLLAHTDGRLILIL